MPSEKLYIKDIKTLDSKDDPRKTERSSGHIKRLAESIKENGLIHPLIVNSDKTLISGHCRLDALKLLGIEWLCWDKEKRTATLPRDTDFDRKKDSMTANTVIEPVTQYDKAMFLSENIKEDILKFCKNNLAKKPLEYLTHCQHAKYGHIEHKFLDYEKQRIRIFTSINIKGDSYDTAIRLLEILDYPDYLLEAFKSGKIDQSTARKWTTLVKKQPELEKQFKTILELEKKGQKIVFDTILEVIHKDQKLTGEQLVDLIEVAKVEQETERKWTDIRIKQLTDAVLEGKVDRLVEYVDDDETSFINELKDYRKNVSMIVADHIKFEFKHDIAKREAIGILWDMHNHIQKQLRDLGEIKISVER